MLTGEVMEAKEEKSKLKEQALKQGKRIKHLEQETRRKNLIINSVNEIENESPVRTR